MYGYHIVLIGCGATGSNVATFISQFASYEKKVKNITLIDGDGQKIFKT